MKDFFISYNKADRDWAVSIDRWLKDAGYSTHFQEADFRPGSNWAYEMVQGGEAARTIAVLSPDYLKANWTWPEMLAAFAADPKGENRKLIFIRVRDCQLPQMLRQIVDINLVGKTGEEARKLLLDGVEASRQELNLPQPYPVDALIERYCQQLQSKISTVRIFGDQQAHPLDQVFVELTINEDYERRPHQAEFLGLMDAELRKMRSVFGDVDQHRDSEGEDDFDNRALSKTKRMIKPDELLRRHTHAVITGAPGCGKTTLLRYLAWQSLKRWRDAASGDGTGSVSDLSIGVANNSRLPVFLELKQLSAADFAQGSLEDLLFNKAIATTVKPRNDAERDALKQHFRTLLEEGRVAIFLDGLDEVSGASFFRDLQTAVTDFLHSAYGKNTVIISTRPFALRQFGDAKAMEIQPLSPRQIEQFIEHYYRDVPERQQFQRELQRRHELRELARVPALLGFILQLWRKRGSVTGDKLELYAQITLELAQQLDREKEGIAPEREWLVEDKDGSLKLDLLRQLAFNQLFKGLIHPPYEVGGNTNDSGRLVFTSEQLRAEAAAFARTLKEREGITINPRNLAEDVKATALLRQVGTDHYAFAHLTLQEYLAAWQLAKRDNGDTCERIFCRAYFNPTLAEIEVLPMTLGLMKEPDNLYTALALLPESLNFSSIRLRVRGFEYGPNKNQMRIGELVDWLMGYVKAEAVEGDFYLVKVLRAFSSNQERFFSDLFVTLLLCEEEEIGKKMHEAEGHMFVYRNLRVLLNDPRLNDKSKKKWMASKYRYYDGLETEGRLSVATLLADLKNVDRSLRWTAALKLREIGANTMFDRHHELCQELLLSFANHDSFVRRKAASLIGYYTREVIVFNELFRLATTDSVFEVKDVSVQALLQYHRKLQYFDIPIPTTTPDEPLPPNPPPPLTTQQRAELETRIAAKYQEVLCGGDARQKGKALEELLAALFASIPGFTVNECNYHTATEEIDLVLRNASADPFWRGLGSLILVEAKNWQAQRVGKNEYVQFYRKLENRGGRCQLGFLICTERFAETFHLEALRDSKDRLRVVPIDGEDLCRLVKAEDRTAWLREFVERAVLR